MTTIGGVTERQIRRFGLCLFAFGASLWLAAQVLFAREPEPRDAVATVGGLSLYVGVPAGWVGGFPAATSRLRDDRAPWGPFPTPWAVRALFPNVR